MPTQVMIYRGWIGAKESDRAELEKIGVELQGSWNRIGTFDGVRMTAYVYKIFRERWNGRGVWGLIPRKELVYTQEELGGEDVPF
jgi:hypothetical protein